MNNTTLKSRQEEWRTDRLYWRMEIVEKEIEKRAK